MPEIKNPREVAAKRIHDAGRGNELSNGSHPLWKKNGNTFGSIAAGGALAVYGMSRKSVAGTALAAAAGFLAFRGMRRAAEPVPTHVERSFTINRPVAEVFRFFRDFGNLPKFMTNLKTVQPTSGRTSHWVARAPLGLELEWDVEILDVAENQYLTWQSLPGAVIPNRGSMELRAASKYHGGTEITVAMDYAPLGGRGGALCARVFGSAPGMQLREDLRRLKQLLEAGEIPTTEGQSHGRRTAFIRMMQAVNDSPMRGHKSVKEQPWTAGDQWKAIG